MPLKNRTPNLLSLSRVLLGGIIICVYSDEDVTLYVVGVVSIALALITDILDGHLARRLQVTSQDGYLLDGLGDRSVYVALILTFYREDEVWGIFAWLLVLREIAIYAIRVAQVEWSLKLHATRLLSRSHALFLRLWFALLLTKDGLRAFGKIDLTENRAVAVLGTALLIGALTAGYFSIYSTATASAKASEQYELSQRRRARAAEH